ncbi:MAG: hypothetical protein AB1798_08305, partial [Spirochaetota bacterium]
MKKIVIVLLTLLVLVAFSAFAGGKKEAPKPEEKKVEAPVEAPKKEAPEAKVIKNPDTFIYASYGDADSLDPAKAYDNASGGIIQNIYETLVYFD